MNVKLQLSLAVVLGTVASGSVDATNSETRPQEVTDSVKYLNLDSVAVIATRATAKTPVAYSTIDRKAIEKINVGQDIPYLLQMTPSLITTSDAGAGMGYTSMRVRGTDGSRINVTANDIPLNDSESHRVYFVNTPDLASSVRDIQIQRGAGTSTNGAGAFGASINMVTASPEREAGGRFTGSYGSYNTYKVNFQASSGIINDHWAVDARLSKLGSDGYIDRATSDLFSYFTQIGYYWGASSLRFLAFGGGEKTYMAWDYASKEDMEKYGRRYNPCGRYTDDKGKTAFYPDQYDRYHQYHYQLLYNQYLSPAWRLNIGLHYTKGGGYYEQYKTKRTLKEYGLTPYYLPDGTEVEKSDLVRLKHLDNHFGGGVFSLTNRAGRFSTIIGGALNRYSGDHFGQVAWVRNYVGPIDPLQEYYRSHSGKTDGNIYVRENVGLARGLDAYVDLQYRHIHYTIKGLSDTYDYNTDAMAPLDILRNYNFFNPKFGLNYQITPRHRAFLSWAEANKEPTRTDIVDADPDRLPRAERLFDYEAGYNFQSSIFTAGVNLYYMDYRHQLVTTGKISDTGQPIQENVAKSYRAGVELQWMLKPVDWFSWQANATFSRNRIKDFIEYIYEDEWHNPIEINHGDTPIAFSPDITLHNQFDFNYRGFDASISTIYVGSQYLSNAKSDEQKLDAYCVTNLNLGYVLPKVLSLKEVRVGLLINNIFSAKYENNGYSGAGYYVDDKGEKVIYRYAGYAAQAPINVMASVSIKF